MNSAAIQRRGVQRLGLHRSCSSRSKVQTYFHILLRVFVQDNDSHVPAGKCRGIGGRVNSRCLQ